jgi:hypothetical protein
MTMLAPIRLLDARKRVNDAQQRRAGCPILDAQFHRAAGWDAFVVALKFTPGYYIESFKN